MTPDDLQQRLQQRLGYTFRDAAHLREALTHPSIHNGGVRGHESAQADNERLEFLGDAVLQLAITDRLYEVFPNEPEGRLTPWRAALVSRERMARLAADLGLGELLSMSRGEERNGGRTRTSNLANAMESVFGAIFRDGGWEAARDVILLLLNGEIAVFAATAEMVPGSVAFATPASAAAAGAAAAVIPAVAAATVAAAFAAAGMAVAMLPIAGPVALAAEASALRSAVADRTCLESTTSPRVAISSAIYAVPSGCWRTFTGSCRRS